MGCNRGAAHPDGATQKRLFAASAGYCQNPGCSRELFLDAAGQSVHVAEMAHVFAASEGGPRADPSLSEAQRGSLGNLILLCANCHTMVDKAPDAFPDDIMLRWKREHAAKLATLFSVVEHADRATLRRAIEPLLAENRFIFERYGPHVEAARDPESGAAEQWRRKLLTRILPNNNRVLATLTANRHLLDGGERETLELLRQHIDDLEAVHVCGAKEDASRYPSGMIGMLED